MWRLRGIPHQCIYSGSAYSGNDLATSASLKGKVYADMAAELLDKEEIPYYMKMDWASSAFAIEAATIPGQVVRILVPGSYLEKAAEIVSRITEQEN